MLHNSHECILSHGDEQCKHGEIFSFSKFKGCNFGHASPTKLACSLSPNIFFLAKSGWKRSSPSLKLMITSTNQVHACTTLETKLHCHLSKTDMWLCMIHCTYIGHSRAVVQIWCRGNMVLKRCLSYDIS